MQLVRIDPAQLVLSPANMRYFGKKDTTPNVDDLVPSVRERGVLQSLLVKPTGNDNEFGVVAGWRRTCAALKVRAEGGTVEPLPCGILEEGDDASAIEASMIENMYHLAPDEMTEYVAFSRLIAAGKTPEEVAKTFGLETRVVIQRLALGNLLPQIREAYTAERIDPDTIRHLTLATKKQQKAWLKLFDADDENTPMGDDIKHWLCGGESISTSVALFPVEEYKGHVISDLFDENAFFQDPDMFWERQNQAIAARREAYLADGWKDVVVLEPGETFYEWQHEKRSKKKGGKVFIVVARNGEAEFYEGYCTAREARRAAKEAEQETGQIAAKPGQPQPETSGTLQTYIDLHRHAVVRAVLPDHQGVALRLMVAHAICGSRLWSVKPEPQRSGRKETDESVKASRAEAVFQQRRAEILALLDFPEDANLVGGELADIDVLFARLMELSEGDVLRIIPVVMGQSLAAGAKLVDVVGSAIKADMAAWWIADDTFLDLVRDKTALVTMLEDVCGKQVADSNISATGKVKRKIIRDALNGANSRAKVEGWVPRWMEFPARRYRADA